jgi:hypothetical protein
MEPIGYVVLFKLPDRGSWEPSALTKIDEPKTTRLLLERTCFSMFAAQADAEEAIREMTKECQDVNGARFRIVAVFPANIAAPHGIGNEK